MDALDQTKELCRQFTNLTEDEIELIVRKASMLQTIADVAQGNVYIDCLKKSGNSMLVVAEAVPSTIPSLYKGELLGKEIFESFEPAVFRVFRSGKPSVGNRGVTPHQGKHVNQNVTPILNNSGQTIGVLILEQDITLHSQREQSLQHLSEATEEINRIVWDVTMNDQIIPDFLEEGLILVNETGHILYANNTAISVIDRCNDLSSESYLHKNISKMLPFVEQKDYEHTNFVQREVLHLNKAYSLKGIHLHPKEGRGGWTLIYLHDVTDLREKERQLLVKSAVIQEIHHRVKNNLQTVASLLRMQLRRGVPKEAEVLYQESLSRIMSIATVHEVLSYSGLEQVNMKEIINKLSKINLYERADRVCDVQIKVHIDGDIMLNSHQGVSLALILTELIQNSLKHAFIGREDGQVNIELIKKDQQVHLYVADNGIGRKTDSSPNQLGLEIVKNLTHYDLNGTVDVQVKEAQGTTTHIMFPCEKEEGEDE